MPRLIRKLVVNEVSSVSRGAGHDCHVVLAKRDDSNSDLKIDNNGIAKMTDQELFNTWWRELTAEERARYRRQQADLDALLAEEQRVSRAGTTTPAEVAPSTPQPQPKKARDDGADGYRRIIKQIGLDAFADHIISEGTHLTEEEFVGLVKVDAEAKGQSLGKVLSQNGRIQKAAARCRDGEFARQAQHNVFGANMRRAAQ
jgi:hypothetical protein